LEFSKKTHGDTYDDILKMFHEEHLHIDRYVLGGEGYADVIAHHKNTSTNI